MTVSSGNTEFLKRAACVIASQLPEGQEDALRVLDYAREILLNLGNSWSPPVTLTATGNQLRLVSSSSGAGPHNPG